MVVSGTKLATGRQRVTRDLSRAVEEDAEVWVVLNCQCPNRADPELP
jgi:hypothetical protein